MDAYQGDKKVGAEDLPVLSKKAALTWLAIRILSELEQATRLRASLSKANPTGMMNEVGSRGGNALDMAVMPKNQAIISSSEEVNSTIRKLRQDGACKA